MTLEDRIDTAIRRHNKVYSRTEPPIEEWLITWMHADVIGPAHSSAAIRSVAHRLIREAPLEIALTSPAAYVRIYREWCEKNGATSESKE